MQTGPLLIALGGAAILAVAVGPMLLARRAKGAKAVETAAAPVNNRDELERAAEERCVTLERELFDKRLKPKGIPETRFQEAVNTMRTLADYADWRHYESILRDQLKHEPSAS